MNARKDCLIITGPKTNPDDVADISMSLGVSEISVIVADISRGKPFKVPADANIEGIIILGQPKISEQGIRDLYPEATIVVVGLPLRPVVKGIGYVLNFYEATTAIEQGIIELDTDMGSLFLDDLVLVDQIEAIPEEAEEQRQAATAA